MEWIRHGDVILQQVGQTKGKQEAKSKSVLAEGEVTGHYHLLQGTLLESQFGKERYVEVIDDSAILSHQEHDSLEIPKGKYRVIQQREVDLLGEIRTVMD